MNIIQKYFDQNNITRYKISKISGVGQSTLKAAVDSKSGLDGLTTKVIKAIALGLGKSPGNVLDDLLKLEKVRDHVNNMNDESK